VKRENGFYLTKIKTSFDRIIYLPYVFQAKLIVQLAALQNHPSLQAITCSYLQASLIYFFEYLLFFLQNLQHILTKASQIIILAI